MERSRMMWWGLSLWIILSRSCLVRGLTLEGQYLLEIKNSLVDKFNHLRSWNPNDQTPCAWKGVSCSAPASYSYYEYNPNPPVVQILNLTSLNLSGTLSPSIGKLVNLTELDLSFNDLSGKIPNEIGDCLRLKHLKLNNNQFEGKIPQGVGKIQALETLNVCNNRLSGPIPDEIGNLDSLCDLVAYSNNLSGSLPPTIGKLRNLRTFRAGQNLISGSLPPEIGDCTNLEYLGLAQNKLTGKIPREIGRLTSLTQLILWENQISGSLPPEIGNCTYLETLALYKNNLGGNIPREIGNIRYLKDLYIYKNELNGTIPVEIGKLSFAMAIDFSENFLTGEIPVELSEITGLRLLYLFQNQLTGWIPSEIFSCTMLQRLDLSRNNFFGSLPSQVGNLDQLELLKLSDNRLSGSIPVEIGSLSRLTELQMGGNLFSGEIPSQIGSLSSLQIALNLSFNNLSSEIPAELGNLVLLENLLLNNNRLTGSIPSSFISLSSLFSCNFSYNDLSGPLLSFSILENMPISSFIGNKGLCGGPLGGCDSSPDSQPSPSDTKWRKVRVAKVVAIVAAAISGVSIVLIVLIVYFMRRPVETVAPLQEKPPDSTSPVSDIYFPKDGFTFQDLMLATDNFSEGFIIGRGACGTVYRAELPSGHVIAVKRLASNREGNNIDNSFRAEILTLGNIRHRNIVKLYGFCHHQGSNLLLYEYMTMGSLGELLHGTACNLDWRKRFMIALGAAEGLAYLHHDCKPRIFHRDIKSNNILLDEKFEAHVGDFGLAKVIDLPNSKSMSAVAGSYGYIAPEYAYTMKITEKCDTYSYGVVLLELLTGRTPVQPLDQGGDLVSFVRNYVQKNSVSPGVLDDRLDLQDEYIVSHMIIVLKIALMCTSLNPLDRPLMRTVVSMLIESSEEREGNFGSPPATEETTTDEKDET